MSELKLRIKEVYGKVFFYPECPTSILISKLTRRKTFTIKDVNILEQLGYNINVIKKERSYVFK